MIQPPDVIVIIFLFFQSVRDLRSLEAEPVSLAVTALTGVFYLILNCRDDGVFFILASFVPGGLILALSLMSRGKIGFGDGLVVLTLGFFVSMEKLTAAVIISAFLSFLSAIILMALRKKDKEDSLPFLPFMLAGYLATVFLQGQ